MERILAKGKPEKEKPEKEKPEKSKPEKEKNQVEQDGIDVKTAAIVSSRAEQAWG